MNNRMNVTNRHLWWRGICIVIFIFYAWVSPGLAQKSKIDLQALGQECFKQWKTENGQTHVFWMPEEVWQILLAEDPYIIKGNAEQFLELLRPYTFIWVMDAQWNIERPEKTRYIPFSDDRLDEDIERKVKPLLLKPQYKSAADIRARIRIRDSKGNHYLPISEDKINVGTRNFVSMLKPIFANMIGPMGENTHVFLFLAKDKEGQRIADPKNDGTFSVEFGGKEFKWKLPLSSLVPPKICSSCEEKLSGAYKFCPWCGTKLPETRELLLKDFEKQER